MYSNVGGQTVLEPLLKDVFKEHFKKKSVSDVAPKFWEKFVIDLDAEESLSNVVAALTELKKNIDATSCTTAIVDSMPGRRNKSANKSILQILKTSLARIQTGHVFDVIVKIFKHVLLDLWDKEKDDMDMDVTDVSRTEMESVETSQSEASSYYSDKVSDEDREEGEDKESRSIGPRSFMEKFSLLLSLLKSLDLLNFFLDHAVKQVIQMKIKDHITETCSSEFDSPQLEEVINTLKEKVVGWINMVYKNSITEESSVQWLSQIEHIGYKEFAKLRISELFDILVEYPDSEPALHDLRQCLETVNLRSFLISNLRSVFEKRLLHPGANTSDIITQYISSIKGLRLLDASGVVLEQVCSPVRSYLQTRDDTVRCIVASLTDDSSNELADELVTGEPVLLDLNEESDDEDQDFDSWVPDPVDADPTKTSKSRQTSDIISLLVNIYGSREMFVSEYRNLLADRLLQSLVYNISREVRNLELLKLRFGESNLHFCEVMIKDIADSKRINSHVVAQLNKEREGSQSSSEEKPEINAFILSNIFWPTFREEKLKLPNFIRRELNKYTEGYKSLKGLRTLEWKPHLGSVQVDLELADRQLSYTVSPIRALIIHNFQDQSTWSVEALSTALSSTPSVIRRHLGYWTSQGVLREDSTDSFTVIERQTENIQSAAGRDVIDDDEESAMASADDQRESDFQVFWAYIMGMLTSLGKMKLDRIHSMLKMFATQGAPGKECSEAELKSFLDKKVREQLLVISGGEYQLPK